MAGKSEEVAMELMHCLHARLRLLRMSARQKADRQRKRSRQILHRSGLHRNMKSTDGRGQTSHTFTNRLVVCLEKIPSNTGLKN